MPSTIVQRRQEMCAELERTVVPVLQNKGFAGSFPHFHRISAERIDVLSFFFNPYGHGFVFKFGRCGPEGLVTRLGKRIRPDKLTTGHFTILQLNWISPDVNAKDDAFWFCFQPGQPDSLRQAALSCIPYLLQVDL
jgi:hypothetical protein